MNLSLRTKLFLTLLCVSLVTILVAHGLMRWSIVQGLERLVAEREAQRLDAIADRLAALHRIDGGWDGLRSDRALWLRALTGWTAGSAPDPRKSRPPAGRGPAPGPPDGEQDLERRRPPGAAAGRPPPPWLRDAMRRGHAAPNAWPPRRAVARWKSGMPPRPLELRLMLLDARDEIVYGRRALLSEAERRPLIDAGERIGTLLILPGESVTERPELRFRERQIVALWIIALSVSLLGALLAFPLSKRLARPVQAFQHTARRLAAGDYDARVVVAGDDELSRLGRDLNALAAALAQTEQARRRWVADISHELRTPLSLLRADVEAMQDGVRPLDRAALDRMHADLLRLGRLIDDLHELSTTDLGALSYRMAPVDLGALLRDELDAVRGAFRDAGLDVRLEMDRVAGEASGCVVDADAQRLSQLFRNLLRNSLAYTDRGGELRILLERADHAVRIRFDDSAPGVQPDDLPRLFDRLYRADASRSRETGGAGLGLAIARNIARAHGGDIKAAPSPLGGLRLDVELSLDGTGRVSTQHRPTPMLDPEANSAPCPSPRNAFGTR